jgi:hypothetical protein
MPIIQSLAHKKQKLLFGVILTQLTVLVASFMMPLIMFTNTASAAQLTSRSVIIGTSKPTATSTWTYGFTTPATTNIGAMKFEACTTPLGTCTSPGAGLNMNVGTTTLGTGWTSANAFTRGAGAGSCTAAANVTCTTRTAASETAGARTMTQSLQVNPTTVGSYFIRITTFSDAGYTTAVDTGVVAFAIVNQLTVNARIQEVLNFCVGTTAVDDATTTPGADCSAISGTTVDIGVLDSSAVNVSPVSTNGGTNTNGIAMVRTNAQSGVVVSYFAEQETSSGKLKVAGATCSGTSTTDQCINSTGTTQNAIAAGTEEFGMTIAGVNCVSTTSYTCAFASGTYNLARDTDYDGNGGNTYGASGGYAWDDTGTSDTIASSASSSVKVVDDEALILKFAATPSITTPTGAYTVTSTYIATATY